MVILGAVQSNEGLHPMGAAVSIQSLLSPIPNTMRRDFLQKHKLTRFSGPVEFANAFIPWTHNPYDNDGFSMAYLTTMTNTKAKLANAGPGGVCYRTYKDNSR
jgi:hypothetical protein